MSALVSIITPSYNSARFINECVKSVLEQTYINWELIIVDDASNDNSRQLISTIAASDNRIKFVFLNKNIGVAGARNIALEKSKGRYIAFLDSDDVWKKQKLTKQIHFMQSLQSHRRLNVFLCIYPKYFPKVCYICFSLVFDKE